MMENTAVMEKNKLENALRNAVASAEMEGYHLKNKEIDIVRESIEKSLSTKEFLNIIVANLKKV